VFFPGSRYENTGTYTVTRADGTTLTVAKLPLTRTDPLRGFHRRLDGQRLDLIASHYLSDATTFWRLCDEGGAMSPDALAVEDLIGIPQKGS
jgi:hypothetical protein